MVRGLLPTLWFAHAQFPHEKVTGDLLFQPFWPAVFHLETMGLKVINMAAYVESLWIVSYLCVRAGVGRTFDGV